MYLSKEEERILDGEMGEWRRKAMQILVTLGDVFGAERLIPIRSAHISGVSYKTLGDEPIRFLEDLSELGARTAVDSTLNPCGFDLQRPDEMGTPDYVREPQMRIVRTYESMGIDPALTCTPYYIRKRILGEHLAWAESSAIVYSNSVLGCRTNREGAPSSLASALVGKTPLYGFHLDENRLPQVHVKVNVGQLERHQFGALGLLVGKLVADAVPLISGLENPSLDDLKAAGAGMAASGMVTMFHAEGVTPEYKMGLPWKEGRPTDLVEVDERSLKKQVDDLSSAEEPDLAFFGCPHCSVKEIQEVAKLVAGRRVAKGKKLWVCTSRAILDAPRVSTYVSEIEAAGGRVFADTCVVVTWLREMGVETVVTNSAKAATYIPSFCDTGVRLASTAEAVRSVTEAI